MRALLAGAAAALLAPSVGALSQPQTYRVVTSSQLLGGSVPSGERVEVVGHAWFSGDSAYLNVNVPSARFPMRVDISGVDGEESLRFKSACHAPDQFRGGCRTRIRGRTEKIGERQGIVAVQIQSLAQ